MHKMLRKVGNRGISLTLAVAMVFSILQTSLTTASALPVDSETGESDTVVPGSDDSIEFVLPEDVGDVDEGDVEITDETPLEGDAAAEPTAEPSVEPTEEPTETATPEASPYEETSPEATPSLEPSASPKEQTNPEGEQQDEPTPTPDTPSDDLSAGGALTGTPNPVEPGVGDLNGNTDIEDESYLAVEREFFCTIEGDVSVTAVTSPEAALPVDSEMHITKLEAGTPDYIEAYTAILDELQAEENALVYFLPYNIYFTSGADIVEPQGPVQVTLAFEEDPFGVSAEGIDYQIIHVRADNTVEIPATEWIAPNTAVTFTVDSISTVGLVVVDEEALTIEELKDLEPEIAGATREFEAEPVTADKSLFALIAGESSMTGGKNWTFNNYYVGGRNGDYDTYTTDDFSLKYQMEFHTSENIPAGAVTVTIPKTLYNYRDNTPVNPTQIAVPKGTLNGNCDVGEYTETKNSSFNYYEDGGNLVFFNYKDINAGTNEAWQVVYSGVRAMSTIDGTNWSLQSTAHVEFQPEDCAFQEAIDEVPCAHMLPGDEAVHDEECGYEAPSEGVSCDKNCQTVGPDGQIIHDPDCSYEPASEGKPCKHVLGEHTDDCGYQPAVPEVPCNKGCVDTDGDGIVEPFEHVRNLPKVDETAKPKPLTGNVNTHATLLSVEKKAYTESGLSHTPGLYTEKQVAKYLDIELPEQYKGDAFKNHRYVVWQVDIKGTGNQPFDLWIKDTANYDGVVVGYKNISYKYSNSKVDFISFKPNLQATARSEYGGELKASLTGYVNSLIQKESEDWEQHFLVVIAYPSTVKETMVVQNTIDVTLVPYDLKDKEQTKSKTASWNYSDYHWTYHGGPGRDKDVYGMNINEDGQIKTGWGQYAEFPGWLEIFKYSANNNGAYQDKLEDFLFRSGTAGNTFNLTHYVNDDKLGERLPNKAVRIISTDDAVYAHPAGGDDVFLTGQDYWFSSVNITQTDYGYDVYEDIKAPPETAKEEENINQGLIIYAMYGTVNPNGTSDSDWTEVARVPWNESGILTYTFTQEQIAKHPYRVKVVHDTINYETDCTIEVNLHINPTSQTMKEIVQKYPDMAQIQFENLEGLAGQYLENGQPSENFESEHKVGSYFQDQSTDDGNYSEPGLLSFTQNLYGTILMRENANAFGKPVDTTASIKKTGTLKNDVNLGRARVTYNISANDGYIVSSLETGKTLMNIGVREPAMKQIIVYDLLPQGMQFDSDTPVSAGSGATVSYDIKELNYKNTGRTLIVFTITTKEEKPYTISKYGVLQEWTLTYGGYWEWEKLKFASLNENIAALMSADNAVKFIHDKTPVYNDDGSGSSSDDDLSVFGTDIDGDGVQNDQVMFTKAIVDEEIAMASESKVEKKVRADNDKYGTEFSDSTVVEPNGGYTYEITVSNAVQKLSDIYIFDRLENAYADRDTVPGDMEFEDTQWHGTFQSVITQPLIDEGVPANQITVWYNANRSAVLPSGQQNPAEVLTEGNGWKKSTEWTGGTDTVQSIAVSLGSYAIENLGSISFRIAMKAPASANATWAYNNPSFYGKESADGTHSTVVGNSVRVRFSPSQKLEVVKEYYDASKVPNGLMSRDKNRGFEFHAYDTTDGVEVDKRKPFGHQPYTLYNKSGESWVPESGIHYTESTGRFFLKVGQKAVFDSVPYPDRIVIEELEDPFWEVIQDRKSENNVTTITIKNKARSVLYVQKKIDSLWTDKISPDETFEFQLLVDGKPAPEGTLYWVVNAAYTDGRLPTKVEEGHLEADGKFRLKANQIIAIIGAGEFDQNFTVVETNPGENWFFKERQGSANGTFKVNGSSVAIMNYYKWRDLLLTKVVEDQDLEDAKQTEFTFQIDEVTTAEDGSEVLTPVTDPRVTWEQTGVDGTNALDNGQFKCKAAAGVITIHGLEAGKTYRVTELNMPEFYTQVMGKDDDEFVAPLWNVNYKMTITNDWLKRPLEVKKIIVYDYEDSAEKAKAEAAVFEMQVKCSLDGKSEETLLSEYPFRLYASDGSEILPGEAGDPYSGTNNPFKTDGEGKLKIKGGQTAVFKDAGIAGSTFTVTETPSDEYEQLSPAGDAPATGMMDDEGGTGTIINGVAGSITVRKEWIGLNDVGKQFVEAGKTGEPDLSVELTMYVTNEAGETTQWPSTNTSVTLLADDGTITPSTWNANSTYVLKPYVTLVINGSNLGDAVSYEISESNYDKHHIEDWKEGNTVHHIVVAQSVPEDDGNASDTIENGPVVQFTNTAMATGETSRISKRLLNPDEKVVAGARLELIVERYDSSVWVPAEGVAYFLQNSGSLNSDRIEYTERDGHITLESDGENEPLVIFPNDKVYAMNVLSPNQDDLRIRELIEESDSPWGESVGVGGIDNDGSYTTDLSELDRDGEIVSEAFVNVTTDVPVRVGKVVEGKTNEKFTFVLKQITEVDGAVFQKDSGITQDNYNKVIRKTAIGSGVSYTVYDYSTKQELRSDVTNKNGEFVLSGGEYAELELPESTLWLINEDTLPDYTLTSLKDYTDVSKETEDSPKYGKLADNLLLVGADNDYRNKIAKVKYAVSIYGIMEDSIETEGKVAGLTLGPATGDNYVDNFKACDGTDASHTTRDDGKECFHWMSWTDIIAKANEDPHYFDDCLANGCTHSVELDLSDILMADDYEPVEMAGDGTGMLYASLNSEYRKWNSSSNSYNYGGWPGSRIRATLNGADEYTADGDSVTTTDKSGKTIYYKDSSYYDVAGTDVLQTADALISAFPAELQGAIQPKKVVSDTKYDDFSAGNQYAATTYDKLWLFSGAEIYGDSGSNNSVIRDNEGVGGVKKPYSRQTKLGITTSAYNNNIVYNESGASNYWWLRSLGRHNYSYAFYVSNSGDWNSYYVSDVYGVAPGFCLGSVTK